MKLVCPICGSSTFAAQGARQNARCTSCRSLERGRLFWMIAQRINLFKPGCKVMHIAPERWLVQHTSVPKECNYWAYDLDTARYDKFPVPVAKIDPCRDLPNFPDQEFDVIVHHHVLEVLPCRLSVVLAGFNHVLKPGGTMAFSIPIRPSTETIEDLNLDMPADERAAKFGKSNQMRSFGSNDTLQILADGLGASVRGDSGNTLTKDELAVAGVPPAATHRLTAHSTLLFIKPNDTKKNAARVDAAAV